jgi:hypothetical protein
MLLPWQVYRDLGGLNGIINEAGEQAMAALGEAEIARLPRLLRLLAVPAHGHELSGDSALTVRAVPLAQAAPDAVARKLVDALVGARLLTTSGLNDAAKEDPQDDAQIRLSHQRVLEDWTRARAIASESADFYRIRAELEEGQRRWATGNRRGELLLARGLPLAEAESVVEKYPEELAPEVRAYVGGSRQRANRARRFGWAAAAAFALLAAGAGVAAKVASDQRASADGARLLSDKARIEAEKARAESEQARADAEKAKLEAQQQRDIAVEEREKTLEQQQRAEKAEALDPRAQVDAFLKAMREKDKDFLSTFPDPAQAAREMYKIVLADDLNGDSLLDFVLWRAKGCGSGGCTATVYMTEAVGRYQGVLETLGAGSFRKSLDLTNGIRDLLVVEYTVDQKNVDSIFKWDGDKYEIDRYQFCDVGMIEVCDDYPDFIIDPIAEEAAHKMRLKRGGKTAFFAKPGDRPEPLKKRKISSFPEGMVIGKVRDKDWYLVLDRKGECAFVRGADIDK